MRPTAASRAVSPIAGRAGSAVGPPEPVVVLVARSRSTPVNAAPEAGAVPEVGRRQRGTGRGERRSRFPPITRRPDAAG